MSRYTICVPEAENYPALAAIWESAVSATHAFLDEDDIRFYKSLVETQYLHAVTLFCAKDTGGNIIGFTGISGPMIEMLFIDPAHFGKGAGKQLLGFAIREKGASRVDVNEQNPEALEFYLRQGFRIKGRSPLDGAGKPFPILHLELPA